MRHPTRLAIASLITTAAAAALTPHTARAAVLVPALTSDYHNANSGTINNTQGWAFTTNDTLTVTSLGVLDSNADGLALPHTIDLWTPTGTLLAEATVPAGTAATLIDGFRYTPITPLTLPAGQSYVIGATYTSVGNQGDPDTFTIDNYSPAPAITVTEGRFSFSPHAFPDISSSHVRVGPSFLLSTTPEPTSLALSGLATAALFHRHPRRRRA